MTFKKDYNELLLHLLRILVKDALYFEEIVSGSTRHLTHIEVKVDELRTKVRIGLVGSHCYFLSNGSYLMSKKKEKKEKK